jgi:hypothetical protein
MAASYAGPHTPTDLVPVCTCLYLSAALQDVDWETNAATAIFVHDDSSFAVARQGLMLTEYGKVDRAKAKSRALHGEQPCLCCGWPSLRGL